MYVFTCAVVMFSSDASPFCSDLMRSSRRLPAVEPPSLATTPSPAPVIDFLAGESAGLTETRFSTGGPADVATGSCGELVVGGCKKLLAYVQNDESRTRQYNPTLHFILFFLLWYDKESQTTKASGLASIYLCRLLHQWLLCLCFLLLFLSEDVRLATGVTLGRPTLKLDGPSASVKVYKGRK